MIIISHVPDTGCRRASFQRGPADDTSHLCYGFVAAVAIFASISTHSISASELYGVPPPNINAYLDKLVKSYPEWIEGHDSEYVVMKTGVKFAISDHKTNKSFDELIEHPDVMICSTFHTLRERCRNSRPKTLTLGGYVLSPCS